MMQARLYSCRQPCSPSFHRSLSGFSPSSLYNVHASNLIFKNQKEICCIPSSLHCLSGPIQCQALRDFSRGPILPHVSTRAVFSEARGFEEDQTKRNQVAKRLENVSGRLKFVGTLSFWGQLVCTTVSAVVLAFSLVVSGTATAQATFYLTAGGITAAFISVFWAYGYVRLSKKLQSTALELNKAPPRADVVNQLKTGTIINLLGMGLTLLGMEATVGTLVAKSLLSTATPTFQVPPGYSPVLALDVFLVQASANTVVSHFLGLVSSLELLRYVNKPPPPPESVLKPA
ncbi:hypothetical protein KP509_01G072500 [Ceratopteris richardii]|uniref:Protein TIC 21, chloroplastic n=1 Tax=Ceratopteris richardii TaxID=49495 RepID=A0A8T2VHE3_CERRI|nr:hypothetical protein KP509_01G072500 [Ceratopteris richardii]